MTHEATRITLGDTGIRIFRGGTGEPCLFLHGGAGLSVWTPFFEALAGQYSLHVPEHPGFGQSDNPAWLRSVADLALFYLDFLDAEGLERVHLVGNSFGGWIAAELAVRDCSRLRSLTLIGPSGMPVADPVDVFRWSYEDSTRNLFHNPAIAERVLSAPITAEGFAAALKNQTTVTRLGAATLLANPDLPRWLHRIRVPTHIVWGAEDRLGSVTAAATWTAAIQGAVATVIPGAGHLPHAEKVDLTAPAVMQFLQAVA